MILPLAAAGTESLRLGRAVAGSLPRGDFLQTAHGGRVESRLILRFEDGSLHDEKVTFSQQRVFAMLSYRLVQRGPSFPETVEASLDRKTGSYKVRSARDGREDASSGSIALPRGPSETVHVVAFTPTPRLIELEMVRAGNQRLLSGDLAREATRYALKPKLGVALRLFATLLGKAPVGQECVVLTEDVPAFVRCDGPLYLKGPVWRIEGTSAR